MLPSRKRRIVKMVVFILPVFIIVFAGLVWAVSALWNWLMPPIFHLGTITYWQALGLMLLSWFLFRGFRGPGAAQGMWRYDMRRRWARMTPEEREEFVKGLNRRCGVTPPPPSPEPKV